MRVIRRRKDPRRMSAVGGTPRPPRCDLHMHSDRSDGERPVEEVLAEAARVGLSSIAITDHDVPPGLPAGIHDGMRLIHGAEVSGLQDGRELHLLVYFPEQMPESFQDFLRERARARAHRYDHAASTLGLEPAPPEAHAGDRAMTRLHLAKALVAARRAGCLDAAFRGELRVGAAVQAIDLPFREAIERARAAGGLPVWAHPSLEDCQRYLPLFTGWGLAGVEAWRPSLSVNRQAEVARIALSHGLLLSGGSDWHGHGPHKLGSFGVKPAEIAPLIAALAA